MTARSLKDVLDNFPNPNDLHKKVKEQIRQKEEIKSKQIERSVSDLLERIQLCLKHSVENERFAAEFENRGNHDRPIYSEDIVNRVQKILENMGYTVNYNHVTYVLRVSFR